MSAVLALLRRVRVERWLLALVALVVAVVVGAVAAQARHLDRAERGALVETLEDAPPSSRGLAGGVIDAVPAPGGDALAGVRQRGEEARAALPPVLASHLGRSMSLVDSVRFALTSPDGEPLPLPTYLTLRAHDGLDEHLTLVAGRMPRETTETRELGPAPRLSQVPVVEVLLTRRTAEEIGVELGEEVLGQPDPADALVRQRSFADQRAVLVRVVGLAELTDADDPFWFDDARLHRPAQQETGQGVNLFPFAILTGDGLRSLPDVPAQLPVRMEFRLLLSSNELAPAEVRELRDVARQLDAGAATDDAGVTWRTGLGRLLDLHLGRVAAARATSLLALTGVLAVAVALVGLVGMLLAVRRRGATALLRGRGASGAQLLRAQLVEAVLVAVPAGAVAVVLARLVVPGAGGGALPLAGLVVALTVSALVATAVPDVRRSLRTLQDGGDRVVATPIRRWTGEAVVLVVTVGAVVALRRRGVAVGDADATDPLLLLTPVLLAASVALVTVRLHHVPLRLAGLLARERRGAAAMLGLARASRTRRTGAPLAVLVVATAVSVVALALDGSVRDSQESAAWAAVGAPYRIDAGPGESLPAAELGDIAGVTDHARDTRLLTAVTAPLTAATRIELALVDLDRFARMTAGTPAAVELPRWLLTAPPVVVDGRRPDPVPGLASRAWAEASGLAVGDVVTVLVGTDLVEVRIEGVRSRFLDLDGSARDFVVVPITHLEAVLGRPVGTERLYVAGSAAAREGLAARAVELDATLLDRRATLRETREAALTAAVLRTLRGAAVLALGLAALALWISLAATGRQRTRDLALLAVLGGTRRQVTAAGLTEVVPAVVVGTLVGGGLGAVTVTILRRPLDLRPFTGDVTVPLGVPADTVLVVAGATALAATLLASVHALASRRAHPRTVLEEVDR